MIDRLLLLAQRGANNPINVWLNHNPLVVGLIAIVLGILLALSGVATLKTGVTRNKLGMEFRGGTAQVAGYVRLLFGVAAGVFGLYKIVMALQA